MAAATLETRAFLRLAGGPRESSHASASDWWRASPRAFGGQLVAHCILAAGRWAPPGWCCHSCHVHFVGAGRMLDTEYQVVPLREGRSLSLFQVRAVEKADGAVVITAVVGFHDVAGDRQKGATQLCTAAAPDDVAAPPAPRPPSPPATTTVDWPARQRLLDDASLWWLGWPAPCSHQHEQAAVLAFLSDLRGASVAAHAHRTTRRVTMITSLDHSIHFHTPPPAAGPGWVLVQLESPWAADGRAMVRMRLWSPEGALLATAVQEAVLRTEPRPTEADAPAPATPAGLAAGLGYDQDDAALWTPTRAKL